MYILPTLFLFQPISAHLQVTVVGTRVLQGIKAVDADQLGPFSTVHYTVLPGPHSVSRTTIYCLSNRHAAL